LEIFSAADTLNFSTKLGSSITPWILGKTESSLTYVYASSNAVRLLNSLLEVIQLVWTYSSIKVANSTISSKRLSYIIPPVLSVLSRRKPWLLPYLYSLNLTSCVRTCSRDNHSLVVMVLRDPLQTSLPQDNCTFKDQLIDVKYTGRQLRPCLVTYRILAGGVGVVEGTTTVDGKTVEDIGCELMNILNFERKGIGGNPIQQQSS
jgi:hypothetical protein